MSVHDITLGRSLDTYPSETHIRNGAIHDAILTKWTGSQTTHCHVRFPLSQSQLNLNSLIVDDSLTTV
jgi:hypothetical protein